VGQRGHSNSIRDLNFFMEKKRKPSIWNRIFFVCGAYGLDRAGSGEEQVAATCDCGNEPSDSIKCGEFLD